MSETTTTYDLVVIGGGPAGYAAAIRAGQLGKKVACIELERAGGTCLNWGCIPSKALLKSAELYQTIRKADAFGLKVGDVGFDFAKVIQRSRGVADQMAKGIEFLFRKNKVEYLVGRGQISAAGMVEVVDGPAKGRFLKTDRILIATGCKPRKLPDVPVDGVRVMTSREALEMKQRPASIIIVGSGAIGVEFAYFLNAFGTKVTLVEMLPQIVPLEDEEVAKTLARSFEKQGIVQHVGAKLENVKVGEKGVKAEIVKGDARTPVEAEAMLLAIGVVPNLDGVLSPRVNLKVDRGYVVVDDNYQTSVAGVFAAGDIIGPPLLAHVATFEAVQAVNGMFGAGKAKRVKNFPSCTYCHPQVASTGLTERAAKEKQLLYKIGKFPFTASGKAVAAGDAEGFVKVISHEKTGEILGVHIIGPEATELIAEYGLAMEMEGTLDEIHHTIHAHPTLSEALAEAAAATHGQAIHI
jgi:dihydrolipoamide dehydrogenase